MTTKKENRIQEICKLLERYRSIEIKLLSKKLCVSMSTLNKDLHELKEKGFIYKSYGTVNLKNIYLNEEHSYLFRKNLNVDLKIKIAHKIRDMKLIKDRDSIFLDSGTTNLFLLENFPTDMQLFLISNWLPIFYELRNMPNISSYIFGGTVLAEQQSVIPNNIPKELAEINIQKAFICASGFSLEDGATVYYLPGIDVRRKVIEIAKEKILLVDSTKYKKRGPVKICDLKVFDKIVVDNNLEPKVVSSLKKAGINLILA